MQMEKPSEKLIEAGRGSIVSRHTSFYRIIWIRIYLLTEWIA